MDSTLLDVELFPASDYNSITTLEEQCALIEDSLPRIAEIYVKNKMHLYYGVGRLHRHPFIRNGQIMVHKLYDGGIDICKAENVEGLDYRNIKPHSFCLNSKSRFQAYEYESSERWHIPLPDTKFLDELRSFLVWSQLTKFVAIVADGTQRDSVEFLLPDNQGMVSVPHQEIKGDPNSSSVVTSWRFCEEPNGRIRYIERRKCDPGADGQHKVNDMQLRP